MDIVDTSSVATAFTFLFCCMQGSHTSLKVFESTSVFSPKFKALKVLENRTGA